MLAGTLIGLSFAGANLGATLLGGHSGAPESRAVMVLEGVIVSVTILFGSLLTAGIIALAVDRPHKEKPAEKKDAPQEVSK